MQYHETKQYSQTLSQFESVEFTLSFLNNTRYRSDHYESNKVRSRNLLQFITEFWDGSVFPEVVIFRLCYPLTEVKLIFFVFTQPYVFPFRI
jgi:hypothetical protein